jgi:DNA-binding beta-propeller fold protein YncE
VDDSNRWSRTRIWVLPIAATAVVLAVAVLLVPSCTGPGFGLHSAVANPSAELASGAAARPVSSCAVGSAPDMSAFDPVNGEVYVPNRFSQNLSVLRGCSVTATVSFPAGSNPVQAAFDPENGWVYVSDQSLDQVYVLNGTIVIRTISNPSLDGPFGVAYDPGDHEMAVANDDSNTVSFVNSSAVTFTTTVGSNPTFLSYDPRYDRILVTNYGSDNVTSMSARHPGVLSTHLSIGVGTEPVGIAFDSANAREYVADLGSGNVTIISAVGGEFGSVPVGAGPRAVAWDGSLHRVVVTIYDPGSLVEIRGSSITRTIDGPSGVTFSALLYDPSSHLLYVGGWNDSTVYTYR